jgi:non-ribosomal peptide synthetase component E (peptide arylation enzyme)
LAQVDSEGWLTISGRIKDVIIRGGENISAAEVERLLEEHPAVKHAVVVGEPNERLGERVCAFVIADASFDLDVCQKWFNDSGATRFTTPERIVRVDEFPLLAAGKPDRARLKDQAGELARS